MDISTETGTLFAQVGETRAIEILTGAGFTKLDYTFTPFMEQNRSVWNEAGWEKHAKVIKSYAEDHGASFNQAHAPFDFAMPVDEAPDWKRDILPYVARSLRVCAILGIPHVVVHPLHNLNWHDRKAEVWQLNLDYYHELAKVSEETGVRIALENMFQVDRKRGCITMDMLNEPHEYVRFYKELDDSKHFICLLDTGHSGLVGEDAADSIRVLGPLLMGLHVNDDKFRNDDHLVPYQGFINWDRVLKALADVDYQGDFTFECLHLWEDKPVELYPIQARYLHAMGEFMVDRLRQFKNAN